MVLSARIDRHTFEAQRNEALFRSPQYVRRQGSDRPARKKPGVRARDGAVRNGPSLRAKTPGGRTHKSETAGSGFGRRRVGDFRFDPDLRVPGGSSTVATLVAAGG